MSLRSKLRHAVTVSKDARWWPFYLQRRVMQTLRMNNEAHLRFSPSVAVHALWEAGVLSPRWPVPQRSETI